MTREISNVDDVIDSRDVIARIAERVRAAAWAKYRRVRAPALAEYGRVRARTFAKLYNGDES